MAASTTQRSVILTMSSEYVEELNTFLSEELGAAQSYDLALKRAKNPRVIDALEDCRECHLNRCAMLKANLENRGGKATETSGLWGGFDKWVQDSAGNELDAIALLEESEAERLVNYEADRDILPQDVLQILDKDLLPAQHRTHLSMSTLLRELSPLPNQPQAMTAKSK
jgi:hypothetical protein